MKTFGKKVTFIGDIHGKTDWREIALGAMKRFQEVVFLGDYFDSFDIKFVNQLDNFKALLAFLRKKGGYALLGNHDYAYIHGFSGISGYQHPHAHEIQNLFRENKDLFKIAWGYRNDKQEYLLATHAGLTQTFWDRYVLPEFEEGKFLNKIMKVTVDELDSIEIHEVLNYLVDKKDMMWKVGSVRGGGGTPGPLWADITELEEDPMGGINQIVGHTGSTPISFQTQNDNYILKVDNWAKTTAAISVKF
jgi:hypothetical protein